MAGSGIAAFYRKTPWAFPATVLFILAVAGVLIWLGLRPAQGTWRYGLCRQFIQFEYAYPTSFDILSVTEDRTTSRIYFAEKNPFGNERIIQADCDYQIDEVRKSVSLVRLSLDRKPVPPERIGFYNRLIPGLMTQKLDVDLPAPLPRTLDQLKR